MDLQEILALIPDGTEGSFHRSDYNRCDVLTVSTNTRKVDILVTERDKALSPDDFRAKLLRPALAAARMDEYLT